MDFPVDSVILQKCKSCDDKTTHTEPSCWEPPISSACFSQWHSGVWKATVALAGHLSGQPHGPATPKSASPVHWLLQRKCCSSSQSWVRHPLSFLTWRRCISAPRVAAEHRAGSQECSINYITPPGASLAWKCQRRTAQDSNNEKSPGKASSNLWWRESVHLASPSAHNSKRGDSFWTLYVNYLSKWGAIQNGLPQAKIHRRSVEMADA